MIEGLKRGFRFVIRELYLFLWVAATGATIMLVGIVLLAVNPEWEGASKMTALAGTKVLFFGYPAWVLFRFIRRLLKS